MGQLSKTICLACLTGPSDLGPKSLPGAMQKGQKEESTKGTVAWSGQVTTWQEAGESGTGRESQSR